MADLETRRRYLVEAKKVIGEVGVQQLLDVGLTVIPSEDLMGLIRAVPAATLLDLQARALETGPTSPIQSSC